MKERNAILVGAAVTTLFTAIFFVIPILVPLKATRQAVFEMTGEIMWGNPFKNFRLIGGFIGGTVTGLLCNDYWERSIKYGIQAAILGLIVSYLLYVVYNLFHAVVLVGVVPPILVILIVPAVFTLPLLLTYFIGGGIGGLLGGLLHAGIKAG